MNKERKVLMLPPGIVLEERVAEMLRAHGIVTTPVEEEVIAIVNEAEILVVREIEHKEVRSFDPRRFVLSMQIRGAMKLIGQNFEEIEKLVFELKRAEHDMVPDLTDREYFKPCRKWNDAPAWTPGGGAPRRRGRRRS